MTGWAVASIAIGVVLIVLNRRVAAAFNAGFNEDLWRAMADRWLPRRLRSPQIPWWFFRLWAVLVGAAFIWLGVTALS